MKTPSKILVLLFTLGATVAHAQTNLSQYVQHVIVVIQENRTPDDLFGQDSTLFNNGGHVRGASGYNQQGLDGCVASGSTPLQSTSYSLSDFFTFSQSNFHAFQTINGAKYQPSCFHGPTPLTCFGSSYPQDPDNDADETD